MTRHLLSKLYKYLRIKGPLNLERNNDVLHLMSTSATSNKDSQPIHMAYTAYEIVSNDVKDEVPIFILHGLLGSKTNWNTMGRQIAAKTLRKVFTLDARNHGDSPHTKQFSYHLMVEDMKQLMEELGIKEVSLLGHSMGGRAMMAFALTNPEVVRDLVVVDISPVGVGERINQLPVILKAMKSVTVSSTYNQLHKVRDEVDKQLRPSITNDHMRSYILMNLGFDEKKKRFYWKVNIDSLLDTVQSLSEFPNFEGVYDKPTLFIAGALSDFIKKEDEPKILNKFPKAKFSYVENAGHLVHVQRPEEFLALVTEFLKEKH